MKLEQHQSLLRVAIVGLVSLVGVSAVTAQTLSGKSIFARVGDQADKVSATYSAIYEDFYGVGKERNLLKAALDVRPDGTPNITLDRDAQKAKFTIRLSVDEPAYEAWKANAHSRIQAVGMSVRFSDFEDPEARVIGGKFYRFGDNEEHALRRLEKGDKLPKKAELVVRVDLLTEDGKSAFRVDIPITKFQRLGFASYPIPLHHLNRLRDLPVDRFKWIDIKGMRRSLVAALRSLDPDANIEGESVESLRRALDKAEAKVDRAKRFKWGDVEDAYANFTLTGLTDSVMNSIVEVRCEVIDDEILVPERIEKAEAKRFVYEKKIQLWKDGPYWADRNIGAEEPWECGYYFWWGDTVGYKRKDDSWVASDGSSKTFKFSRENTPTSGKSRSTLQNEGWITEEGVLAAKHDVAQVLLGGRWRMPTKQELDDLCEKCDWTETTVNGVKGNVVRGRDEYASASIFLPCAGYGIGSSFRLVGSSGYFWSSVLSSDNGSAWGLDFSSSHHNTLNNYCDYGRSIRPVQGFAK